MCPPTAPLWCGMVYLLAPMGWEFSESRVRSDLPDSLRVPSPGPSPGWTPSECEAKGTECIRGSTRLGKHGSDRRPCCLFPALFPLLTAPLLLLFQASGSRLEEIMYRREISVNRNSPVVYHDRKICHLVGLQAHKGESSRGENSGSEVYQGDAHRP